MKTRLSEIAKKLVSSGLSIIPVQADKSPALPGWTEYQKRRPTSEEVGIWFLKKRNVAIICGAVSGNAEVIDFDCEAEALERWATLVQEQDGKILDKLIIEKSPHGAHVIYRCKDVTIPGNMKLARKAIKVPGPGEHQYRGKTLKAQKLNGSWFIIPELIETRGEGGYCVVHPSAGYELKNGSLLDIPVITKEEREILIDSARACNEWTPPQEIKRGYQPDKGKGMLPGEDYDRRGDIRTLLQKHGWTYKRNGNDGRELWARPGKNRGHSATLTDGKVFFCFSSNGHPFEAGKAYGPFAVYAMLEQGGDFKKASRALAKQGYGTQSSNKNKGRRPQFMTLTTMERQFGERIEMIWRDDLIPKSNPCIVAGPSKAGKTSNVGQMSKEITDKYPDGYIMWVCTEGFAADHADKWAKLRMPDRVVMLSDDRGVYKLQLDQWKERNFLDEAITELKTQTGGQVIAVVIDSIRGMQSLGENDPKISNVISYINSIVCDKHKAACIYIAHTKKRREEKKLNNLSGSTGIASSVRAVYFVERLGEYVCQIEEIDSNIMGHKAKRYKSILIENDDGHYEISIVKDDTETDETAKSKAEKFLISLFRDKTKYPATEIYQLGTIEGLSTSTLKAAKTKLPIKAYQNKVGDPWIWECSLYKQKACPWGKSEKIESKKPNKINERHQRHENFEKTQKNTPETPETPETREIFEEKKSVSGKKPNNINERVSTGLVNCACIKEVEDIPEEGIAF